MLGTIVLFLAFPLVVWAAGELLARIPAVRWIWETLTGPRAQPPAPFGTPTCGQIRRPPDLPPRDSLHDRRALPAYDPGPGDPKSDDELPA